MRVFIQACDSPGATLADPVSDATVDENSEKLVTACTPAAVADLIWSCWVPGALPTDIGIVTGLNLTKLMDSEQKVYRSLLGVLSCNNLCNKHRKAAADALSWFVVNSALYTKDLQVIMKQLGTLSQSKDKEIEITSLRAIRNLCEYHEGCKQVEHFCS